MSGPNLKFDFDNCSDAELKQWLISKGPIIEQFIIAAKRFCSTNEHGSEQLSCNTCKERLSCKTPCDKVKAILPSMQKGKGRRENLTGFYPDTLQVKERVRREDIFEKYNLWKAEFTKHQWAVIEMYYDECMTEKEIAQRTGKARTTINGLLNRAKKTKEECDKKLRRETREQMKKK